MRLTLDINRRNHRESHLNHYDLIALNTHSLHQSTARWLLILVITMTPWLSFWTSPLLSHNSQGETVILCTINGFQAVTLSPEQPELTLQQATDYCAVLQLADALNSSPTPQINLGHVTKLPYQFNQPHLAYAYRVPHLSAYSSRAPPPSFV